MHPIINPSLARKRMAIFNPDILPPLSTRAKLVTLERVRRTASFQELKTRHIGDDLSQYVQQTDMFSVDADLETVWDTYTNRKAHELWAGPRVSFLFSYSKEHRRFYYPSSTDAPPVHVGQQFFCLLHFGWPVGVVGMELLGKDPAAHTIELAYLEGGLYRGLQIIYFRPDGPSKTRIIHVSYQWGEKAWVRKLIPYRYLHRLTVGEFHAAQRIQAERKS